VSDSHADVAAYALYTTRLPGGAGAVRELCDLIVKAKDGRLSQ
jgi:3-deoxy-D-manno-octulosonate 8-phosphate phosphatase KdsC-like HAD superfamily phosphatase